MAHQDWQLTRTAGIAFIVGALSMSLAWAQPNETTCAADTGAIAKIPKPASPDLLGLLAGVSDAAEWADLPAPTRQSLEKAAGERLSWFGARWSSAMLQHRMRVLVDCPTPKMKASVDAYLAASLASGENFSLDRVASAALRRAFVRVYLADFAAYRAYLQYGDQLVKGDDWDGATPFDSFPLPDATASLAIRQFANSTVAELRSIPDNSLSEVEARWMQRALIQARTVAAGSFVNNRGGLDWEGPCQMAGAAYGLPAAYIQEKRRPPMFHDDNEAVAEFNAIYLSNTKLQHVDVGTFASARDEPLCHFGIESDIRDAIGGVSPQVARAMLLLRRWWLERTAAMQVSFSTYDAGERTATWAAFTAGQSEDNQGVSRMETFAQQVAAFREEKVRGYQQVALAAVSAVFPDSTILNAAQRESVTTAITTSESFGRLRHEVADLIDKAQGTQDGTGARAWNDKFTQHVQTLGGLQDGKLRPSDVQRAEAMAAHVKAWLVNRYRDSPIPFGALLESIKFTVTDEGGANTETSTGNIRFGIGTTRSLLEYYSIMLHEMRHALAGASRAGSKTPELVPRDEGAAVEGVGVAAEDLLRVALLTEVVKDPTALLLYQLDFAIRDARYAATTEATLNRYFRTGCGTPDCPDAIEAATRVAHKYGLRDALAATLVRRAHAGTQYLQYIYGGEHIKSELAHLQSAIATDKLIDPFVLFGCGLNTPQRHEVYVQALRNCLGNWASLPTREKHIKN